MRGRNELVDEPLIPDYAGGCITNVVPALLGDGPAPVWLPSSAVDAERAVLLVLDGLGWEQLADRRHLAPTLAGLVGGPIHSVCPTTTATALTSITTGLPPGQHGVVGYRVSIDHDVLNVLRWSIGGRDARDRVLPEKLQHHETFCHQHPAIVTRAEFRQSGFTRAHLDGTRFNGYRVLSTMVTEVRRLLREHEPFVYAYYDGLDKVSHEYGLGEHYDAELVALDALVATMLRLLPEGTALVVTADHGQVDVGDRIVGLHPDLVPHVASQSGEGRFRWLHARPGREQELLAAARSRHGNTGWVVSRDQVIDEGWFGPTVTESSRAMLGDVALVAREPVAYEDPDDTGPYVLVGRHGSMTSAEVLVPLLVGIA